MRKHILKKSLIAGIILFFIYSSFAPSISGFSKDTDKVDVDFEKSYESKDKVVVSCQTYGIPGKSLRQIVMSKTEAENLLDTINGIVEINTNDPLSDETEKMQEEIISLAKEYELILMDTSLADFQPRFFTTLDRTQPKKGLTPVNRNRGTASLCNFVTTGSGMQFPIIILPRLIPILLTPIPRAFLHWSANEGFTSCGSYLTGTGFMAEGMQRGTALGFWGIGFSVFIPPVMAYGFIGYALFATCTAEEIEPWPPNNPPVISNEQPSDGIYDVSISLSELSFKIEDIDGDDMNFVVRTYPDIGSADEFNKMDGIYSVPISGLDPSQKYTWTVEVTDGFDTVNNEFFFITEELPFDPFEKGWQYRKKITIDHTKVEGDLENFPVLISTTDPDLKDKAQFDGDDILFMDDVDIANKMYHELENYNIDSGEIISWIKVDDVKANEDTIFYMYYGNPNSGNQQSPKRVWDSDYEIVYHLSETSGNHKDSTSNNYDGVPDVAQQGANIGKIDGADEFTGQASGSDKINPPDQPLNDEIYQYTIELWYKADNIAGTHQVLFEEGGQDNGVNIYVDNGKIWVGTYSDYVSNKWLSLATTNNEWHYVVLMFDDDNFLKIFHDGKINSSNVSGYIYRHEDRAGIGALQEDTVFHDYIEDSDSSKWQYGFDGIIDEFKISNTCRSAAWISTEYNNQDNPSGFLSFGPEEKGP